MWGFCGDSHRFLYGYGMGMGIKIQSSRQPWLSHRPVHFATVRLQLMSSYQFIISQPAKDYKIVYQAYNSVCSVTGLRNESVYSSRDGMDVLSRCRRSWNDDTGGRQCTSWHTRRRQVRWTFAPTSSLGATARPGRTSARRPSLESWAELAADLRRPPTTPTADMPLRPTCSTSWTSSFHSHALPLSPRLTSYCFYARMTLYWSVAFTQP